MDREKKTSLMKSRIASGSSKNKALFPSGDFIALGSKSDKAVTKALNAPPDRKPCVSPGPSKKPKLTGASSLPAAKFTPSGVVKRDLMAATSSAASTTKSARESWESKIIAVDAENFLHKFTTAEKEDDENVMTGLLCGTVKLLKAQRPKPESVLYLSLMFLAKTRPKVFQSETVLEAFVHLLKRDNPPTVSMKAKCCSSVAVLAANILLASFQDVLNWPDLFVRALVDDSLGDRIWVDHEECKGFVDNILTAFNTRLPPKSMMAPELTFKPDACPSPPTPAAVIVDDDDSLSSLHLDLKEVSGSISVMSRYTQLEPVIEKFIMDVIQEQLTRRQPTDISRNLLKLMVCACGISNVRVILAHRLETWLSNPKLTRPAQDLLLTICMNCNQHNKHDIDVISYLVRIRIKLKPVLNHFLQCVKELLGLHPENLTTMLKQTIFNELSQSRNPNNMSLLSVILQHSPDKAAKVLAELFQDLLANRDDYLRCLRALFREIIRSLRHELSFHSFCSGLMTERTEPQFTNLEQSYKERLLVQITDLITLSTFMAITPAVKECATAMYSGREKRDMTPLHKYHDQISSIQNDAVTWLYTVVMRMYRPGYSEYMHCLRKVFFLMEGAENYCRDNWPPEGERALMIRIASDMPVLEGTLLRILFIGMSKEHPTNTTDAIELVDQLIRRAGTVFGEEGHPVLNVGQLEIFDIIFSLCAYHQPDNYSLPSDYTPPSLAISDYYWRAFLMMLIVAAHNPIKCGDDAWQKYPTVRVLMQMCITNHFEFPPATTPDQADDMKSTDTQIAIQEKQCILEFETHLAAASTKVTITEQNSLLLSKLITMSPNGHARKPPQPVIDQLKLLNDKLKLGHLLCRSRNPDFLLQIIQQQGSSQSMPWLAELVESSEGSLDILPVQCLCEFLLTDALELASDAQRAKMLPNKRRKLCQLTQHLRGLLRDPETDKHSTKEVVEYFTRRLASHQLVPRNLSMKALQLLLSSTQTESRNPTHTDFDWLLVQIPELPHCDFVLEQVIVTLRSAIHVETDPSAVTAYVVFLSLHSNNEQLADVCLDLAHLLVERATIMNCILPQDSTTFIYGEIFMGAVLDIFIMYLRTARSASAQQTWFECQEHVQIEWSTGETAQMHILVVHSMIIALTYGPPQEKAERFHMLLHTWFPQRGTLAAFLVGTREEALLLPDWLKLRMIRSSVDELVDAALKDLDPNQLVLFIQSFGIPVRSMSKLLKCLDTAVDMDAGVVSSAVSDKGYMSQLVEVQHKRGATGGEGYKQLLRASEAESTASTSLAPVGAVGAVASVIQLAPRLRPVPQVKSTKLESVDQALYEIFGLETHTISVKVEQDLHRSLLKLFAEDIDEKCLFGRPTSDFIHSCERVLENPRLAEHFVAQLHFKATISCSLFKLVIKATKNEASNSPLVFKLQWVCSKIIEGGKSNTPLMDTLRQCVSAQTQAPKKSVKESMLPRGNFGQEDVAQMSLYMSTIACSQPNRFEEAVWSLVERSIRNADGRIMCQMLSDILVEKAIQSSKVSISSLVIDWLEHLEPESIWIERDTQTRLMFEKQPSGTSSRFRSYLISLLIHRAHWHSITSCIRNLLLRPINPRFDASAVLDFLSACMHIPKIWQGRDKKLPKHHSAENVLTLSSDEICAVAEYMIYEVLDLPENADGDEGKSLVSRRMHIIEQSCVIHPHVTVLVDNLLSLVNENSNKSGPAKILLEKLYLNIPSIILSAGSVNYLLSQIPPQKSGYTPVDNMSHSVLLGLFVCDTDKNLKNDLRDLNLSCRKLVATHPELLLRQLPLIGSLLNSRISGGVPMFGQKNYRRSFFICILGVLELMKSRLFNMDHISSVNEIFDVYLEAFLLHLKAGHMSKAVEDNIGGNLNRLLNLVQSYAKCNPDASREFLASHQGSFEKLAVVYKNMPSLKSLVCGACHVSFQDGTKDSSPPAPSSHIKGEGESRQRKTPLVLSGDRDAILQTLQSLEMSASRNPAVLELYHDELHNLLSSSDNMVCKTAFKLMLQCIENNPSIAGRFISSYLQCLASERRDIVTMALEKLPEFVILSEEHGCLLLQKAFQLGISSNVNSTEPISETLLLLNMQYGN